MKVEMLIKRDGDPRWRAPMVTAYKDEDELRMLLKVSPELLPGEDASRPVVLVHEFPVKFGSVDLVGVSPAGDLTVVECKLRVNPEMKRTIVGQLFAYAASLWGMSYEEFDDAWQSKTHPFYMTDDQWEARKRPPLIDDMVAASIEHGIAWDREGFVASVTANLRAGRYTLVIAVDEITPELEGIIDYLSQHTSREVNVIALELGYVADRDIAILVPHSYGLEIARQKVASAGPPKHWDEALFTAELQKARGDWAPPLVAHLLGWAERQGLDIWYGAGDTYGTVYAGLRDATGTRRSPFGCSTTGSVYVYGSLLKHLPPFDSHEARVELIASLSAIDGIKRPDRQADSWSTVDLESLRGSGALAAFTTLFDGVVSRVRQPAATVEGVV